MPDLGGAEAAAQRDLADGVGGDEARVHRFVEPRGAGRAEVGHHRGERDRAVAAAVDVGEDLTGRSGKWVGDAAGGRGGGVAP